MNTIPVVKHGGWSVLLLCRKWKSCLYEGHHGRVKWLLSGKDCDAFHAQTDTWWSLDFPAGQPPRTVYTSEAWFRDQSYNVLEWRNSVNVKIKHYQWSGNFCIWGMCQDSSRKVTEACKQHLLEVIRSTKHSTKFHFWGLNTFAHESQFWEPILFYFLPHLFFNNFMSFNCVLLNILFTDALNSNRMSCRSKGLNNFDCNLYDFSLFSENR